MTDNRIQAALNAKAQIFGGWVTGPTILGPEQYAAAGYDYVGIDIQHGYLDDADAALLIRGLEHLPIAVAVRLPNADPAPIGRVLDAGADAVIIALVDSAEQAAAAVAASRYAPAGVRSYGPLRASLGNDIAAIQARANVFVMIETATAVENLDAICGVEGLAGVYVGPSDLAISMGRRPGEGYTDPTVSQAIDHIGATAQRHGLIPGVHAGTGKFGKSFADRGFRLITLAAESKALRSGAEAHLAEATGTQAAQQTGGGYQ